MLGTLLRVESKMISSLVGLAEVVFGVSTLIVGGAVVATRCSQRARQFMFGSAASLDWKP
jgi:hypothetical protein